MKIYSRMLKIARSSRRILVLVVVSIIFINSSTTVFGLWINDDAAEVGVHMFASDNNGVMDIKFFSVDGVQMSFYKSQDPQDPQDPQDVFFVDSAELKDEYIKAGAAYIGDHLVITEDTASIKYVLNTYGYYEIQVMPSPGFILQKFVDLTCGCYMELENSDGVYRTTPDTPAYIGAVFVDEAAYWIRENVGIDKAEITLILNDKLIFSEVAPFVENGRTMVPVRLISEAFGADVNWDNDNKLVTITAQDGTVILLTMDSEVITINGVASMMDTVAMIKDGRTFIPVRYVAEALNLHVDWIQETSTVSLSGSLN